MNAHAALATYEDDASEAQFELRVSAFEIGSKMHSVGLPSRFVAQAVDLSAEFDGILRLMKMWSDEVDQKERDAIVADIQELIDDCSVPGRITGASIRFDDLDRISSDLRAFKDSLRVIVDESGGIKRLAELTHIPQPSLSRFFNSGAMPRRVTLNKIARALGLTEVQMSTNWSV
jgi:hypothetical protein